MTSRSTRPDRPAGRAAVDADPAAAARGRIYSLAVWGLALGYCAFYAPYSSLVKALSRGLLPGVPALTAPLVVLPVIGFATVIVTTLIVTWLGWWRYCEFRTFHGWRVPWPRPRTVVSGIATAAIIYTTTLMFTFRGVSIVVALIIMRGGVLVLAPLLDLAFGRHVRWFAWAGLTLSLGAVASPTMGANTYQLDWALAVTAGVYLLGYVVRLRVVNLDAKSTESVNNRRYFVEEQFVAMMTLAVAPLMVALFGGTTLGAHAREGLTTFVTTTAVWPALAIGALYGCLYCFGTLVYCDRRENTFCVALNRGASLLAGVVGSAALALLAGEPFPGRFEIAGAAAVLCAILVLSPLHHTIERLWERTPQPAPALEHEQGHAATWPQPLAPGEVASMALTSAAAAGAAAGELPGRRTRTAGASRGA